MATLRNENFVNFVEKFIASFRFFWGGEFTGNLVGVHVGEAFLAKRVMTMGVLEPLG